MCKCNLKQICETKGIITVKELQTKTRLSKLYILRMWNNKDVGEIPLRKFDMICVDLDICLFDLIEFPCETNSIK